MLVEQLGANEGSLAIILWSIEINVISFMVPPSLFPVTFSFHPLFHLNKNHPPPRSPNAIQSIHRIISYIHTFKAATEQHQIITSYHTSLAMTSTIAFPTASTARHSISRASIISMSVLSGRRATAMEVCDLVYGNAEASLDAIDRFYEANASTYPMNSFATTRI